MPNQLVFTELLLLKLQELQSLVSDIGYQNYSFSINTDAMGSYYSITGSSINGDSASVQKRVATSPV